MIIGVDIRVLGSDYKSGIEEYTENLLATMIPLNPQIKYKLFYSSLKKNLKNYDWLNLPNVKFKKFRWPNRLLFLFSRLFNRPQIDRLLKGVDVFFSPHFVLSPLSKSCKRITVFHDLSYLHFPEFFSWRRKIWHFEMNPLWQLKFSDKIISVSESTKYDLADKYKIDPGRIEVIYSGISSRIKRPREEELIRFKKEKNLPDEFILFLGKFEPRKNIEGIIKAFNILKTDEKFENLGLVLIGSRGWLYRNIFEEIQNSKFRDHIIHIDHILDDERPYYYSLASVFVFPSFFEGFGFPPLEAMKCETPVIASNSSSLSEILGDSALLVDPYNISEISNAIKNILDDQNLRKTLIKKGTERLSQFDWQKTAQKTLDLITRL